MEAMALSFGEIQVSALNYSRAFPAVVKGAVPPISIDLGISHSTHTKMALVKFPFSKWSYGAHAETEYSLFVRFGTNIFKHM